ncbi:G protein-coupled receptor [Caenorhabditis elegans]|uniref:G protein-coupled receptor n=1 Tax=Caenorhabditis elegans TaxID=6239 RepID=A4GZK9_CAEEL|nr:G protein-coupled receptor [Caenorhabditis elegans]CCD71550.2 G protein-coupled receptor [Caenorhabditis elegans]
MGAIGSTSSATLSSILLTTVPTVPEEEVSESGRTVQTDWIIGILMMIFSLACAIAYYVILVTIYKDKELSRMASYRFMFFLGIFDIAQCFPHFVTGIFTIKQSVFYPGLAKAMGVIATPCYVAYAVLTIFLSFNRLIQLSSPSLDKVFFGGDRWMIWIGMASFFWIFFMLALASPWATIRYIPDWYSWDYDYELSGSFYVQKVEMYIEVGGIFVSAFFYLLIIYRLVKTKKRFLISKSYNAEIKVLIQATVITVYCTVLNVLWHNYSWMLPQNLWSYTALNFMWILNSGVYPIIYFIVNKALRDRIGVKRSTTVMGAVSVFQQNKTKMERTDTSKSSSAEQNQATGF